MGRRASRVARGKVEVPVARRIALTLHPSGHKLGPVLKPSAREWLPYLRARLREERPELVAPRIVQVGTKVDQWGVPFFRQIDGVYGPSTFRNVIDDEGRHV